MKIALVQLSDIHLTEDPASNPVLGRSGAVARAVASVCHGVDYGVLVVSGDTAYSGKEVEYQHGRNLTEGVRAGVRECFAGGPVQVLTIAGNHDCDFTLATSIRGIVLDSLKPEKVDDAVIAQCAEVQRHYDSFAATFNPLPEGALATGSNRIYRQEVVEL